MATPAASRARWPASRSAKTPSAPPAGANSKRDTCGPDENAPHPPATLARPAPAPSERGLGRGALHDRRAAAVDVDRATGHIGRSVRGEEGRDIGEFLGPSHPAERHRASGLCNILLKTHIRPFAVEAALDLV